jgi:molybdopterin-guanine dinucleotide biosynthesis protein A
MSLDINNICTVILAGGRGSRMQGQDKGLLKWQGKPLVEHIINTLGLQQSCVMISANRNMHAYGEYGFPVISDSVDDYQGPLAGILTAMLHAQQDYLLCVPCDSPQPPADLLPRLIACITEQQTPCAICHDGERLQPLFCLLSCELRPQLQAFIAAGHRKVHDFFLPLNPAICDFSDQQQNFSNFNRPEDMQ